MIEVTVCSGTVKRPATVGVTGTGLAPGQRVNVRVDGTVIATLRAGPRGYFDDAGLVIGSTATPGKHTVDIRDSANKVTLAKTTLVVTA